MSLPFGIKVLSLPLSQTRDPDRPPHILVEADSVAARNVAAETDFDAGLPGFSERELTLGAEVDVGERAVRDGGPGAGETCEVCRRCMRAMRHERTFVQQADLRAEKNSVEWPEIRFQVKKMRLASCRSSTSLFPPSISRHASTIP